MSGSPTVTLAVRAAKEDDASAIAQLDASYVAGRRVLAFERAGVEPEVTLSLGWRDATPIEAVYGEYPEDRVRAALQKVDLFLIAEDGDALAGLLMVIVPPWADAGEITDLVVDRSARRRGAGRALVDAAVAWARDPGLRALWVEPRADNSDAIEFYLARGFRLSGYNDRMYSNSDDEDGKPTLYMYIELDGAGA